ncbi:hypothetical protein [Streptomyces canus]|uniref:hypothetical protein n=1 Tax=Streptomyces canus TaxID=58343 RepID=UPI000375CBB6|nr:hypothetical protein [Streptomyces canus]
MPDPTTDTARLLRDAERYLSALHGSVARHDNLAAGLACAGCELRDKIRTALPALATGQAEDRTAAALTEVRRLCEMTVAASARVQAIDQARDTLAVIDRVMGSDPAVPVVSSAATLRDRIAEALMGPDAAGSLDSEADEMVDAVLAVLPSAADWDALTREADRLRREGAALDKRAAEIEAQVAELRRLGGEPQPGNDEGEHSCAVSGCSGEPEPWDVPDARPGTTDHTLTAPAVVVSAAGAGQDETPCGPAPDRCDAEAGEPCTNHEREQAHAEGEHAFCGPECGEPSRG